MEQDNLDFFHEDPDQILGKYSCRTKDTATRFNNLRLNSESFQRSPQ